MFLSIIMTYDITIQAFYSPLEILFITFFFSNNLFSTQSYHVALVILDILLLISAACAA